MAIWNSSNTAYQQGNKTLFEAVIIADQDGNPINTFGPASNIPISNGAVGGYTAIHKFGLNGDCDAGNNTIWTVGGDYPWSALNAANTLYVSSTSGLDTQTIRIEGLDVHYNSANDVLTLNGTNEVATDIEFKRVFRAYITSDGNNVGDINIKNKPSGVTVAQIAEGRGQTLMTVYTVPANTTGYMMKFAGSVNKGADGELSVYKRPPEQTAFRIQHMAELYQNYYEYEFTSPLVFTQKTDIEVKLQTTGNNFKATSTFDMILVDNNV